MVRIFGLEPKTYSLAGIALPTELYLLFESPPRQDTLLYISTATYKFHERPVNCPLRATPVSWGRGELHS